MHPQNFQSLQRFPPASMFLGTQLHPEPQRAADPPPGVRMNDESDLAQKPLQALVVEDSPAIAERLVEMLNIPGRVEVVATATTEAEAVAACVGRVFDIAVVDLQLAQGTGFGVIRRLRADAGRHTTIVVLTNHAVPALKIASFEAGADHFLDKSKDFPAVPRVVEELLSERE